MNKLIDSGVVLAIISAFLYCSSTAYFHGFLEYLKLDSDILNRNFHQVLYNGLIISFLPILKLLTMYWLFRFSYSHLFIPNFNIYLKKSYSSKRKLIKFKKMMFGVHTDSYFVVMEKKKTNKIGYILITLIVFLLFLAHFESEGSNFAQSHIEKYKINKLKNNNVISAKINGKSKKLYFLVCGSTSCAGIDPKTNNVYYFNLKDYSYKYKK